MSSEFWAAIVGAIVGGLISLGIQLIALHAAKKERQLERKDVRASQGRSVLFKVMRIHSDLDGLYHHIEDSYSAVSPAVHQEPFTFVQQLANFPEYVHFNESEISLVMTFKDDNLLNSLMSLDVVHNSMIEIFRTYNAMRSSLTENMPAEMSGYVGTSTLDKKQMLILRPKMVEANMLLTSIRARAKNDYDQSRSTLVALHKALAKHLDLTGNLEFKSDN
jgi:hypothetical protein